VTRKLIKGSLLLATTLIVGCAASLPSQETRQQTTKVGPKVIQLECRAASYMGCRYKGRVYPWNAWVEMKGYDSKEYAVKEVIQTGPRAMVHVIQREKEQEVEQSKRG